MSNLAHTNATFGWSPTVREELDRAFRGSNGDRHQQNMALIVPASMWETEDHVYAELDLPGFTIDDLSIVLEKGVLKISGERKLRDDRGDLRVNERRFGYFERQFRLSEMIDEESVDAEYHDGVLCLTLKKREEALPKKIQVKHAK